MNKDDLKQRMNQDDEIRAMYANGASKYDEKEAQRSEFAEYLIRAARKRNEEQAQKRELAEYLIEASHRYGDIKMRNYAVRLVGEKEVIVICLNKNLPLRDDDRRYIIEKLG